jgi:hypothetical protein
MASNTLLPFEILLLSPCLLPGQTSFKEGKASVKVEPQADETILFFNIDDQSNPACKLRKFLWEKETGQTICDLIVFYAKESERVICFVELKENMSDLGHATDQVINTYNSFKLHLNSSYKAKAFIYGSAGSVPNEHQEYQNKLSKVFKKNNFEYSRTNNDLGNILRGIPPKIGGGKRNKRK